MPLIVGRAVHPSKFLSRTKTKALTAMIAVHSLCAKRDECLHSSGSIKNNNPDYILILTSRIFVAFNSF